MNLQIRKSWNAITITLKIPSKSFIEDDYIVIITYHGQTNQLACPVTLAPYLFGLLVRGFLHLSPPHKRLQVWERLASWWCQVVKYLFTENYNTIGSLSKQRAKSRFDHSIDQRYTGHVNPHVLSFISIVSFRIPFMAMYLITFCLVYISL